MTDKPIELTEAEWTVIKAVWEGEPAPPGHSRKLSRKLMDVLDRRTLMDRMVTKGLLRRTRKEHHDLRTCCHPHAGAARRVALRAQARLQRALHAMVQCLLDTNEVSRAELDQLKQLIATHEKSRGKGGGKREPRAALADFGRNGRTLSRVAAFAMQRRARCFGARFGAAALDQSLTRHRCALTRLGNRHRRAYHLGISLPPKSARHKFQRGK